jgi:diguanylate cyclase (GGDEF)-like protein/PAS domain S-box-containing protein
VPGQHQHNTPSQLAHWLNHRSADPDETDMVDPFRHAFDVTSAALAVIGTDGRLQEVNDALCGLSGFRREQLVGEHFWNFTSQDDSGLDTWPRLVSGELHRYVAERAYVDSRGQRRLLGITLSALAGADGRPTAFVAHVDDRTSRRTAEERTREAEDRFSAAFEFAPIGMAIVGLDGQWLRVNHALCRLVGRSENDLLRLRFQDITHADDLESDLALLAELRAGRISSYEMEKRYRRKDGRVVWVQLNVSLARDGDGSPRYYIAQIQDISDRRSVAEQLEHRSQHDPLTGLANRSLMRERLAELADRPDDAESSEAEDVRQEALLFLDIDDFKSVNDVHGHAAGDELLVEVAARLVRAVRAGDVVARFGGDEFVVLATVDGPEGCSRVAARVQEAVNAPLRLASGVVLDVRASVGCQLAGGHSPDELLALADRRMYEAKRARREGLAVVA